MNQSVHVSKNVHTHIVVIYLLVFSSIYFFWFATTKPRTHPTSFPPTHPSGNCRWLQGAPKRRASMNLQSKLPEHGHNWKRGRKTKKETMATGWKRGGGEKKRREEKISTIRLSATRIICIVHRNAVKHRSDQIFTLRICFPRVEVVIVVTVPVPNSAILTCLGICDATCGKYIFLRKEGRMEGSRDNLVAKNLDLDRSVTGRS